MIKKERTEFFEFLEASQMTQRFLARKLKVNYRTVFEWKRRYLDHPRIKVWIIHEVGNLYNVTGAERVEVIK